MADVRAFLLAARVGVRDLQAMYTWRTWLFGWTFRVGAQVAFFALVGTLLASEAKTQYFVVGNSVFVAAMMGLLAVAVTTRERRQGTLTLLVAAPASPAASIFGRSLQQVMLGLPTATLVFYVMSAILGTPLPWPRAALVPVFILLVGLTTYVFGTFLGSLVLYAVEAHNLVSNVGYLTLLAIAGVNVPTSFYPAPIDWLAQCLPLTHDLLAVRRLLAGEGAGPVLAEVGLEVAVGVGWLLAGVVTIRRLIEHGRADGSLEFAA